jgi:hypothetical protein
MKKLVTGDRFISHDRDGRLEEAGWSEKSSSVATGCR